MAERRVSSLRKFLRSDRKRFSGRLIETYGKTRSDAADGTGRIVDGDAAEAFAGDKSVKKMAERLRSDFVARGFDPFGDIFCDDGRTPGQLIAQILAFRSEALQRAAD